MVAPFNLIDNAPRSEERVLHLDATHLTMTIFRWGADAITL
jgi:hypothetical protein